MAAIAVAAAFALPTGACSPTEILEVQDPDIIDPANVRSAPGAQAVRVGALSRFNAATSGAESLFLLGGLFSDEWINGDSFIARQEVDQRVITAENTFLTAANRTLHRARFSAEQAIELLAEFDPTAPTWQVGEMHLIKAFVVNLMAEHLCDGIVLSSVVDGRPEYGMPITTEAAFELALGYVDDGLALTYGTTANDLRVLNALRLTRGRILTNLDRLAEATTAVTAVPTSFAYVMQHSQSTNDNAFWSFNNNARRYSVGSSEGTNGINFATAADPRVPVCIGNDAQCRAINVTTNRRDDQSTPVHVQMLWPTRDSPVTIMSGVAARLIEAEALLAAGNPTASLDTLNDLRAAVTGLAALTDPGTDPLRLDQLFRERAFWLFGRGHRVGDMRRLIRQYGRASSTVFPVGAWHKGGTYGADVNMPVPFAEANNPNVPSNQTCLNRDP
jgi:hypothetical protein